MSGTDTTSPRPMNNTSASPSYIAPDAIAPDVDGTIVKGVDPSHPELSQSHKDNIACRIADVNLNGEYTAAPDASNPVTLDQVAHGAFLPSPDLG